MRNQRIILIVALLLLLLGGGAAVYFIVFDKPAGDNSAAAKVAPAPEETGKPQPGPVDPQPDVAPANQGTQPVKDTTPAKSGQDENNKATVPTPVVEKDGPAKTEPATRVEEDPTKDWPLKTTEYTITGKITYRADGRAAPGANITAEDVDDLNAVALPADGTPKRASSTKIEGSTTSDSEGEFTLKISVTSKQPPETPAKAGDPDPGSSYARITVVVVGRMAGYAPARSGVRLRKEGGQGVTLSLAVPAALSGRVIDAVTRKGIEGATLQLYEITASNIGWSSPRNIVTD